jgi:hypothetical protein
MKLRKKITSVFLSLALLSVVAGFCDALFVSSASASMNIKAMAANDGQMHYMPSALLLRSADKAIPMENSLKPCCTDKHAGAPTTETSDFNVGTKILATNIAVATPNLTSFFENKLKDYSDASPPKPDVLSSVLRLE